MNNTFSHPTKTMSLYPTTKTMSPAPIFACLFYYYYSLPCTKYAIKSVSQSCTIVHPIPAHITKVVKTAIQLVGSNDFAILLPLGVLELPQKIVGTVESCYSLIQVIFLEIPGYLTFLHVFFYLLLFPERFVSLIKPIN